MTTIRKIVPMLKLEPMIPLSSLMISRCAARSAGPWPDAPGGATAGGCGGGSRRTTSRSPGSPGTGETATTAGKEVPSGRRQTASNASARAGHPMAGRGEISLPRPVPAAAGSPDAEPACRLAAGDDVAAAVEDERRETQRVEGPEQLPQLAVVAVSTRHRYHAGRGAARPGRGKRGIHPAAMSNG